MVSAVSMVRDEAEAIEPVVRHLADPLTFNWRQPLVFDPAAGR